MTTLLRNMNESDLDMVLAWRNTESVRKNMYTNHLISPQEHREWWNTQSVNPATRLLIFELDGEPLGVVTFTNYTGEGGTAAWAFYSGNMTRRGIGQNMELAALDYAFSQLKLRRLECEVLSFNQAVIDFHRRHGFVLEGVAKQAYQRGNEFYDIYHLAMLASDWNRFIKKVVTDKDFKRNTLAGLKRSFELEVTTELVEAYSMVTSDQNPVHLNDEAARTFGFSGRIAHGMLFGGFFSRFFANEFPGPGTVYVSQDMSFLAPIPVGVSATANFKVVAHIGRFITIESTINVGEEKYISGEAVLLLPKDFNVSTVKGRK